MFKQTNFKQRFTSLLLVALLLMGSMIPTVLATETQAPPCATTDSDVQAINPEASIECGTERIQATLSTHEAADNFAATIQNQSKLKSADLNKLEQAFACKLNVTTAQQIQDSRTDRVYTRFVCADKTELSFDENGQLFKISTIYGDGEKTVVTGDEIMSLRDAAASQGVQTTPRTGSAQRAKLGCLRLMPQIRAMFQIADDYPLTDVYDFDEEYVFYTFEKLLDNGVYNPYQSINVVFNKRLDKLTIARKFEAEPNALTPKITERDALCAVERELEQRVVFDKRQLTYIDQRKLDSVAVLEHYDPSVCYLVYALTASKEGFTAYVDALTGEWLGSDFTLAKDESRAFAIQESKKSSQYNYNGDQTLTSWNIDKANKMYEARCAWAGVQLFNLGYYSGITEYKGEGSAFLNEIKNYLNKKGNNYAFYFTGHGSSYAIGFKSKYININEVNSGNWHFVFLDACDTAANQNWANKFSIYPGSSRRAFLGWSNKVTYEAAFDFANAFWPRINGKNAIRQAAVDAANEVPGQGTTPIRFFGDQSYNGLAWKTK